MEKTGVLRISISPLRTLVMKIVYIKNLRKCNDIHLPYIKESLKGEGFRKFLELDLCRKVKSNSCFPINFILEIWY